MHALSGSPSKEELRRAALARRDEAALDVDTMLEAAEALRDNALTLPELTSPLTGPVAGYWPLRSEIDPRPILEILADRGVTLALPVCSPQGLLFRAWQPWQPLVPAGFGTLGPPETAAEVTPRVLLVPLAAFDRAGHRIGYGKGHYDGAIARLSAAGALTTIGLALACQEVASVPAENHDQRLDVVVTQSEVIRPQAA